MMNEYNLTALLEEANFKNDIVVDYYSPAWSIIGAYYVEFRKGGVCVLCKTTSPTSDPTINTGTRSNVAQYIKDNLI